MRKTMCPLCGSEDLLRTEDFMTLNIPIIGGKASFTGIRVLYCKECGAPVAEIHDANQASNAAEAIEMAIKTEKYNDILDYTSWHAARMEKPNLDEEVLVHLAGMPEEEAIVPATMVGRGIWKVGSKYMSRNAVSFWSRKQKRSAQEPAEREIAMHMAG